jgi:predicted nucleic acid-binding protein
VREILFDTDAFLCVRSLGLLTVLEAGTGCWVMTEYVALRELCSIGPEIERLKKTGRLSVEKVAIRGNPAADAFKQMRRAGNDPGEAEAIAWAIFQPSSRHLLFISNDAEARATAKQKGVSAGDVMDLVVEALDAGEMSLAAAKSCTAIWDDKHQSQCRPRDFTTFDELLARRRGTVP